MQKFKDFKYERPNIEEVKKSVETLLERFNNAETFETQNEVMNELNLIRSDFITMGTLVSIRHSIDTNDEFYEKENEYFDEVTPLFQQFGSMFYQALVNSKFRNELEAKWGKQLFTLAELTLKTFSPEIIEDLQEENKLKSQYQKLQASAKIMFEGEERNLSQMGPFSQSTDRDMRKRAQEAVSQFFIENEQKFDELYDQLVKVRTKMAQKLGYDNYIELGYARMSRSDYNSEMVANYRKQVYEDLVPLATSLRERQAKRLGLDELKYYDENLQFLSGNATPKGNYDFMVNNAKTMYTELSKETEEFFNKMLELELMDLETKKGKAGGGYCTFLSKYEVPFIFSNFNGTSDDVDVLTHEAGHAFQMYSSRHFEVPEYLMSTIEAAEIHSMSMEFFTWPWMQLFFKEDEAKYKFSHLSGAILFIPYGVSVDEFQHFAYENPNATPEERKAKWREIEHKYLPHRNYEDNAFLERGGFWFRQAHIFLYPLYYIDYTLAQVCAFQYWAWSQEDQKSAWDSYLKLCQSGGSQSFLGLLELAQLDNPFIDGTIKKMVKPLENYLNQIDDSQF